MTQLPGGDNIAGMVGSKVQESLQKGALGILGLMCIIGTVGLMYAIVYLGPKVVDSIQSIAPTITAEISRQSETHALERKAWTDERKQYIELIQKLMLERKGP
jgi:butyrate kinase